MKNMEKTMLEILNKSKKQIISEQLGSATRGLARKSLSSVERGIIDSSRTSLRNVIEDVMTTSKNLTPDLFTKAIRENPMYSRTIAELAEKISLAREGKSLKDLSSNAQKKILDDVTKSAREELQMIAKEKKIALTQDLKTAQLAKSVDRVTDIKLKLQNMSDINRSINGLPRETFDTLSRLTKIESKQVSSSVLSGSKNFVIKQGGKLVTLTKDQILKGGQRFKVMSIKKKLLLTAGLAGSVALLYYFFGDNTVLTDENGNNISDEGAISTGGWVPCIQKLIDSRQGKEYTLTDGSKVFAIKDSDYPQGVRFYQNNRVQNMGTGQMGKYTCKDEQVIQESLKMMSIIKNIINEQSAAEMTQAQVNKIVHRLDGNLSGDWAQTDSGDMRDALRWLKSAEGKTYKGQNAVEFIKNAYKSYTKSDLLKDVQSKLGKGGFFGGNLDVVGQESQAEMVRILTGSSRTTSGGATGSWGDKGLGGIKIVWDNSSGAGGYAGGPRQTKPRYRKCESGPYTKGCYNKTTIPQVQRCLGLDPDGKFWTLTQQALENIGYSNGFTDEDIPKICKTSSQEIQRPLIEPMSQKPGTFSQQKPEVDTQNMNLTGNLGLK